MELGLDGKTAIITGGGEGIGFAAAARIAQEGGNVVIVGRRKDVLEKAAQRITAAHRGRVLAFDQDITAKGAAGRIVDAAVSAFGGVDILVNNAGISLAKPFDAVSQDEWEADFDLKLWAAIHLVRAALPPMRQAGGGRIINVTNLDGRTPRAGKMPTSISRAAGIAFTKGLSHDLAADNILVNTVCIGFIKSGQHERRFESASGPDAPRTLDEHYAREADKRGVPLGRVGEGAEAGDVIAFLASERASYITGVAINIDGGACLVV
ncbi:SDR family oxidoreductase [Devosia sp. YIM 151766]|uniref:SDR family NAD(P)-dependent oxidoreductase n=1 Tax=Devosia sp. YIM 151766 TaxID=3017325 RepID=UPI00255D039D|nr:SDR family NAD(P)-dependent oxidoreductase [Devosia sp. YIM 151766]WIY52733.1 SDR family oxidoreductase [Devosia sp. YIM 151766]